MKRPIAALGIHPHTIRAGVISLLILAICFPRLTGLSGLPGVFAYAVAIAVCFVLMMKSIVDLMVCIFGLAASYTGMGLGHSVRLLRRAFRKRNIAA